MTAVSPAHRGVAVRAIMDSAHVSEEVAEAAMSALIFEGWQPAGDEDDAVKRSDPLRSEAIHTWFNLTYANYLVLPRSVLQSMPDEWQTPFVALLDEMEELYGGLPWPVYAVNVRGDGGRFEHDPIPHYQRGRTRVPPCPPTWGSSQ